MSSFQKIRNSRLMRNLTKSFRKDIKFVQAVIQFIRDVAHDPRIPERDKTVLLAMVALIVSPFDLIPDWIPVFGMLDDIVILALILDYLFNVLEADILLSHYPWGMKSFARLRRAARAVALITPAVLKEKIWKYKAPVA